MITVNGDSDSSDEEPDADPFFEMKQYIKQARNSTKVGMVHSQIYLFVLHNVTSPSFVLQLYIVFAV